MLSSAPSPSLLLSFAPVPSSGYASWSWTGSSGSYSVGVLVASGATSGSVSVGAVGLDSGVDDSFEFASVSAAAVGSVADGAVVTSSEVAVSYAG